MKCLVAFALLFMAVHAKVSYEGWKVYEITTKTDEEKRLLTKLGDETYTDRSVNFLRFPSLRKPAHLAVSPKRLDEVRAQLNAWKLSYDVITADLGAWKVYEITTKTDEEKRLLTKLGDETYTDGSVNFHRFPSLNRPAHLAVAPKRQEEITGYLDSLGLSYTVINDDLGKNM